MNHQTEPKRGNADLLLGHAKLWAWLFLLFAPAFFVARGALQMGWDLGEATIEAGQYSVIVSLSVTLSTAILRSRADLEAAGMATEEPDRWDFLRLMVIGTMLGVVGFAALWWLNRAFGFWIAFQVSTSALIALSVVIVRMQRRREPQGPGDPPVHPDGSS